MPTDERRVSVRRLGEPVQLLLEVDDLLPGLAQRGDQASVVVPLRREFAPDMREGRLELVHPALRHLGHHVAPLATLDSNRTRRRAPSDPRSPHRKRRAPGAGVVEAESLR